MALVVTESYDDYLLLFFLLLIEIWGAKFSKDSTLFFFLLLTFYTIWLKMQDILYSINLIWDRISCIFILSSGNIIYEGRDMNKKEELEKKLDEIALSLEKTKIVEYVDLINNRKRLLYINFIQGLARGFGMAVGFSLLGALIIYLMRQLIRLNLPIIGDFISEIVRIVLEKL